MEEELNENELEERLYSMLHYVDETQVNVIAKDNALAILENTPESTVRRYWRPSGDGATNQKVNTPYQKVNNPKETPNKQPGNTDKTKPKEEKSDPPDPLPAHLSVFQTLTPQNVKNTIEIIEFEENRVVELESSDEDEVIEVALPPKPTITIESSDEDDTTDRKQKSNSKTSKSNIDIKPAVHEKPAAIDREVSASPVLSVVSSVSDEFIRSDCIALNISSRKPDNHNFDFSLHGSDLLVQNTSTPTKKKKKKKNKDVTPIPTVVIVTPEKVTTNSEECFATPKSKAKNKKQRTKSYSVSEKSIPNADVYDSDSNQSIIDCTHKYINPYAGTDKSLPSVDVYESDSNQSETVKADKLNQTERNSNDVIIIQSAPSKPQNELPKSLKRSYDQVETVDLTENSPRFDNSDIQENIVIGNVTGFTESDDYDDIIPPPQQDIIKYGSTRVPAILYENLDFDNLKGKNTVCKSQKYSLETLHIEMEKFYNESWGGEDFNHREIQKYMSRDKSLWAIDPKDKMPTNYNRRKPTCNYCNRTGHRDDMCRIKPPVCYMCGSSGHFETRCPRKICVNCGSPNNMYSTMCRNCCAWGRINCAECGQPGHPSSHCPDIWRRYHNTIEFTNQLEQVSYTNNYTLHCSGCTRRGHLVHTCRNSLPFSGLPMNSPFVQLYAPVYFPNENQRSYLNMVNNQRNKIMRGNVPQDCTTSSAVQFRNDRNKRQSKSPIAHENHANKKRTTAVTETAETPRNPKSPANGAQSKIQPDNGAQLNIQPEENKVVQPTDTNDVRTTENVSSNKAPDFIPIGSTNRDNKGQIIQDSEVSDTSDVVTSARIFVTNEVIDKIKTNEGKQWLKETTEKLNVTVQNTDIQSFLTIKGKVGDQEAFQTALRDWTKNNPSKENAEPDHEIEISESENKLSLSTDIPKKRTELLRVLNKSLQSLKTDLGEPKALYKKMNFFQNRHRNLLNQKVVNTQILTNTRQSLNKILKTLNMILLGQAGLGDGSSHVNELYSLQEKITNCRQKTIPVEMRRKIGLHYHSIFSEIQRNDYKELLETYYRKRNSVTLAVPLKRNNPTPLKKKFTSKGDRFPKNNASGVNNGSNNATDEGQRDNTRIKNELVFFHKRVLRARPYQSVLKKTKMELMRKLHSSIASLTNNESINSKNMKKMQKMASDARTFLNNVTEYCSK